jgi:hypothetical protein
MSADDMLAWLRGCLDEDEEIARTGGEAMEFDQPGYTATDAADAYLYRFSPARELRQVAAHRRTLDRHRYFSASRDYCTCEEVWPCLPVRDVASVYADQPGYRPEWGEQ